MSGTTPPQESPTTHSQPQIHPPPPPAGGLHLPDKPHVVVLGAGAVGLSTAVNIQKLIPEAKVQIVADRFTVDTTSDGAAGFFRPIPWKTPGVPEHVLRRWCMKSWAHYAQLTRSQEALEAGCMLVSGYHFFDHLPKGKCFYADLVHNHRQLTEKELANLFAGKKYKYGEFSTHLLAEPRSYLPYLTRKFRLNGGTFEKRHVASLKEFAGRCDVLVNCTGLGSRALLDDHNMTACRGQLVKVHAPWLKTFIYTPNGCYILPGKDYVTIGGTLQYDDYSTEVRADETKTIMDKAIAVVPALKHAPILEVWAGLRPFRTPLRLEKEVMQFNCEKLNVVHNYGHGAEGISLSWGTGMEAAELVASFITRSPRRNTTVQAKL